ncbi:MAG: lysine exporter LysO family protein, partial [Anaerovoracaceae bacterium]
FIQNFKKAGIKVIIFPIVIGLGTLLAALVCSIFIPISVRESLAIGAGFGWYSLAPVIIMEKGFITASAISFMHNILRELLGLLFIPIVAQKIGYLESIAIPGSAASDVCLPIIAKSTKSEIAIYSFISGVTLSALVPILVPIMIG